MTNNDIADLQTTIAFQDQKIDDLNDMVTRQWDEIEKLRRQIQRAENKLSRLEEDSSSGGDGGSNPLSVSDQASRDKPPHY